MTVEAANNYLSSNEGMLDAFELPTKMHFTVGKTIEEVKRSDWMKVAEATEAFFTTGVGYLANRGEGKYLQELGTVAWWTVNQKRVITALTDHMASAAVQLGVPPVIAAKNFPINDEPQIIMMGRRDGKEITEVAYVLMPPEFVVRAQNNAVEGLATTAYICSQIRDLANGRLTIDQEQMNPRAWATESHFLQLALKIHPEIVVSSIFHEVMERYPNGLDDLPAKARYRGISGEEFRGAPWN